MSRVGVIALAGVWTLLAASLAVAEDFPTEHRLFITTHCSGCHEGDKPKGNLAFEGLSLDLNDAATRQQWAAAVGKLRLGEMPPASEPRPPQKQIDALIGWLKPRLLAAESAERARVGRVVLRRLNRAEYENTIQDLLGITVSFQSQLPADGAADGFDNAGAALHTSSFLLEKYLDAAETALNLAIANRPQRPKLIQKRYSIKDGHPVRNTTEDVYRFRDDGAVICFCSSEWHNASISTFYPSDGGKYRFKIAASGIQSQGKPVTFRVTAGRTRLTGKSGLVGYFDAPPDETKFFDFTQHIEPKTTIAMLPYGLASANTVSQVGGAKWDGSGLAVEYVDVEGPLYDSWPPESHRRLFDALSRKNVPDYNFRDRVEVASEDPPADALKILQRFVPRAFRRPVTDAELAPYLEIVTARLGEGATFETAVRAALKGVLVAPEFLFLQEKPGKLDDAALASRLSYFLWSSMPDDELADVAREQRLHEPAVLRAQVERLLTNPKATAFTENFVGQWLGLREIDATEPSHLLYPEYDHLLKVSMIRETELFFDEVLRHDLSLTNFVHSDFMMLNGRLAKHYGIDGIAGWEFQRMALPTDSHRGGVLTMASVMKVTANGTTTSPVLRGAWVLDRILGTPAPPPPADVSAIDPDIRGASTIREQLAKHRDVEACNICHRQIDPPGFALESFDCIGGWRDRYRVTGNGEPVTIEGRKMHYRLGKPVDPSSELPTGEAFSNIDELKQLLLRDKDRLARALTTKLVAYATGKAPQPIDADAVNAIVDRIRPTDFGLRSLIHAITQSELFQQK